MPYIQDQGHHSPALLLPQSGAPPHISDPGQHSDEVPLVDQVSGGCPSCRQVIAQPYRTTPLVLPYAKTIHDTVPPARFLSQHPSESGVGQVCVNIFCGVNC